MNLKRSVVSILLILSFHLYADAQISLRQKIGQMIIVTFTGDSLEKRTASLDTLRMILPTDLLGALLIHLE